MLETPQQRVRHNCHAFGLSVKRTDMREQADDGLIMAGITRPEDGGRPIRATKQHQQQAGESARCSSKDRDAASTITTQ